MKKAKLKVLEQVEKLKGMVFRPHLSLDEKMLPAIKDWKVGDKYEIMLKVKQVSLRQSESGMEASFEILSASPEEED